jgi:hypothetical protein
MNKIYAMAALGLICFWAFLTGSITLLCMYILQSRNFCVFGICFIFAGFISQKIVLTLLDYLSKKFDP